MLQTPLSAVIPGFVMAFTGRHLIITRIMGAVLHAGIATLMYRIAKRFGGGLFLSMIPGCGFILLFIFNVFFEYSGLIVFLEVLLIDLDTRVLNGERKPDAKFLILSGLLGGMAILSKQSFGLFIAAASWLSAAFVSQKHLRAFFLRGLGSALFCLWMLFYFLLTGTFDDCIDLCLRGISTFAKPWYYWVYMSSGMEHFWQGFFLPPVFMCGVGFAVATRREKIGKMTGIALWYILFSFINMYPLANSFHINTCFGPALVLLVPVTLALTNPARGKKSRLARKGLNLLSGIGVLAMLVVCVIVRPIDVLVTNGLRMSFEYKHYEGIFLSSSIKENMAALEPVITKALEEDREIYILDNTAELYFVPYDIYHNHLDMFLYGNSGGKSPEDILEESYAPGAVYLMAGDDRKNTQFPWTEMRAFKKRLEQQEDVGPFEMYTAPINNTTP